VAISTSTKLSPEKAKLMLTSLFGPNTETKLAVKRNQDLMKVIAAKFDSKNLTLLLSQLAQDHLEPNLKLHFPV
jgi:hypothetical protein